MPALQKEKERFTLSSIPRQLLLQIILILLNAFFAAAEIAVVSLNTTKLRRQEEEGDKKAGKLLKLVEEPGLLPVHHTGGHYPGRIPGKRLCGG